MPNTVETRWNFKSRVVNTAYENKELLIEFMNKIEATSNQFITINQALRRILFILLFFLMSAANYGLKFIVVSSI